MKRFPRLTLASILAVAVLAVPSILAAAKELSALTVSGPGINGVLALNNPQGLLQLQQYGFFGTTTDTSNLTKVPQNLGTGYRVTGYLNLDGNSIPFVQGIYYPAIAGEQSYIHFTGGFDGTTMKATSVDRWAMVSPAAAAVFSQMVAAQGATLQIGVQPATVQAPVSLPVAPVLPASLLSALIVAGAVVLAAGSWLRKRSAALR
jgi:hypothetical protein